MQALQDNFFYHSKPRLGSDGDLQHEKQLLIEEQKLCTARARRFTQQTNRRRKVLEEKRKQWDLQEQQYREKVLQLRRQQVQDATERFQRAHLPSSQRQRQSFRKHALNIEDALKQIKGTVSSYTQPTLSSHSNITRSCTPSPKPPTVPKSSQALSVVDAYTQLLQEQSSWVKSSQEIPMAQERQQDHSTQDNCLSWCSRTESLSSKDSLEDEEPSPCTNKPRGSNSFLLVESERHHQDLRKQNDLCPSSDLTSLTAIMHLDENLPLSRKLHGSKQKKQDCSFLSLCEISSADPEHFDVNLPQNSSGDNIITSKVGDTIRELSCPKQETLFDLKQQEVHAGRQLKYPSASEIFLMNKKGSSNDVLLRAACLPNVLLNDSTTENVSQNGSPQQPGKDSHYMPPQKELRSSINNVYEVSNLDPKTKKPINTVSPQQAGVSYFLSETPKSPKCPEKDEQKLPVSEGASHAVHEVRFVKGILKKESKHMKGDITHVYGSGQFIFAKQVALAIRDSVELTKMKTKEVEGKNTVKKLRWLDEVQMEKVDKQQNMMKGRLSNLSQSKNNSEDHQLSLTAVSGASKPGPSLTPSASPGYHFTKQAWADVGVQVSLPQERVDEVKVPRCSTRTGGPKALQRELTARVGAGPVSSWIRKGIVMQPQAATGVSQIAKTHGRMLVPRPPPRRESTQEKSQYPIKTPYGKDHTNVNCKQPLPTEEALHKDNLQGFILPYTHIIRTDSSVIYTPLPPSYTCPVPESNMKYLPSLGHQDNQSHGRRRRMVCSEKGLCLDCTPTDDEISQLWHSVRSALSTKDEKNIQEREATGGGQAVRKPCMEQSRQPPDTRNKRLPQSSQATQQPADQERLYSIPGEVHAEGLPEGRDVTAAMATVKTQMPGTVQQRQQQGLTSISLEEQKILLSLDRLNHHLHSVREHFGGPTGTGIVLTDTLSTREMKTTNHHRHNLSNNRTQYQKKC